MKREFILKHFLTITMFIALTAVAAFAQGTGFNFQGRLNDGTNPANGQYDLQFRLYNAATGGAQIGSTLARPATVLINGVFSTALDFGATAFNNPGSVFIEIAVKPANSPNAYTILGPRQQLTVVPFSVRANNATNADNATNAQNAVNATNAANATNAQNAVNATNAANATNATTANNAFSLGGVPAANYAQLNVINTGDLRTNGAIAVTGNAFQPIEANGFVKAMLVIRNLGGNGIERCYNGITNSSTGNCGFVLTNPLTGVYRVNFGFPISNRFISATAEYLNNSGGGSNNSGISYRNFDSTTIEFFTWTPNVPTDTGSRNFTVILF